ncbi:MAG: hypothetical protein EHM89_00165 [Acidobacteria bacterium]|nr:MAG: hypothetical protein EHM89_00165 [Acidobacteriota bacterium]
MARVLGHRALDFDQPLYVRAPSLKGWNRTLKKGDLFPWRELKLVARKVHQLWMQRAIGHERIGDPPQGAERPHGEIALPRPAAPGELLEVVTPRSNRKRRAR